MKWKWINYLCTSIFSWGFIESVLVHDPIGLCSFGCFAYIKDKGFLDSNFATFGGDHFISSGGFPVTGASYSVWSRSVWIFSVPRTEKVPFFLPKYCLAFTNLFKIFAINLILTAVLCFHLIKEQELKWILTGKNPRIKFVKIDISNNLKIEMMPCNFSTQILNQ